MMHIQKEEEELRSLFNLWMNEPVDELVVQKLAAYAADPGMAEVWQSLLQNIPAEPFAGVSDEEQAAELQKIYQKLVAAEPGLKPKAPVRKLSKWLKYAAAILIIILGGGLAYYYTGQDRPGSTLSNMTKKNYDIAPNTNRATLVLSNGQEILLDTSKNGQLARQTGALIYKSQDGHITYEKNNLPVTPSNLTEYNTIKTPKGGQCRIVLPDGTVAWLNTISSITFPTAFTGSERKVSISGEVYLEVAKNASSPFKVTVNDEMEVEVLGTHFNISAYEDDAAIYTTLLEGKVRVVNLKTAASMAHSKAILEPGKQAFVWRNSKKSNGVETKPANIDDVMAWRKGKFNFQGKELKEAMKELERWYDIEVIYEKNLPQIVFEGKIDRHLKLSQVLNGLRDMGVKFNLTGDGRLIIGPGE